MGIGTPPELGSRQYCSNCGKPYAPEDLVRFGAAAVCAECKPAYVQQMREGAIGTGVATNFVYGGFWRRFLAVLIDGILLMIVQIPINMLMAAPLRPAIAAGQDPISALGTTVMVSFFSFSTALSYLLQITYYVYFISQKGATLGKMVMGVKVVTANGGPVSVGRALGRYFAQILSGLILCIGFIMAAFDDQKRALHDHICNTRVIRD